MTTLGEDLMTTEADTDALVQRVYAALNSGRDEAVVRVVLDETDALRAEVKRQRTAADSARAAIANMVRILPADRHELVAAGGVRDALFTPGPSHCGHPNHGASDHDCAPFALGGCIDPDRREGHCCGWDES